MKMLKIYEKIMKGYLKDNNILKYLFEYKLWHFQKVFLNTCSMCAPNDMNTYPICDFRLVLGGLSVYFVNMQDFFEWKNTGFNNKN